MNAPKISVIVPVYNTEKYLRRCVDSILAQTYTDFELLLIDDGSTDGSPAICDEYAALDSRVRVFHKPNGGVSSARNLGLDHARGEWITFCDADDYVYPEWLQNYDIESVTDADLINQGAKSNADIFRDANPVSELSFSFYGPPSEFIEESTQNGLFGYLWIKCFRNDIIKERQIRFDTGVKFQEDELFITEFLKSAKVVSSVDKIGYYYFCVGWHRYNNNDIYDNYRNEKIVDNLKIIYQDYKESQFFRERQNSLIICLVREYLQTKNKELLRYIRERIATDGFTRFPNIINRLIAADPTTFLLKAGIALLSLRNK
jgi:glycosyltransferase